MRRALSLLCLVLTAASLSWHTSAAISESCAATSCTYLPIIRDTPPVFERRVDYNVDKGHSVERCGEIVNTLSDPIYDLQVTVSMYDLQHQLLQTGSVPAKLPVTFPGGLNIYCKFVFTNWDFESPDDYEFEVQLRWSLDSQGHTYAPVSVIASGATSYDAYAATLRNDTSWSLQNISFAAWTADDDYYHEVFLLDWNFSLDKRSLAPGETAKFYAGVYQGGWEVPPPLTLVAIGEVVEP